MAKKSSMSLPLQLWYRDHCSGGNQKRVWRDDWAGDVFEVLDAPTFIALKNVCSMFNIPLKEAEDN